MRKFLFKSLMLLVVMCLALFGFAACSDDNEEPNDGKFDPVDASTIKVVERDTGMMVSWGAVPTATGYLFTCNSYKKELTTSYINLFAQSDFTLPSDGVFKITIVAKSYGYTNSDPVEYTYTAKGVTLNSPQVVSFEDGTLEWSKVNSASAYRVSVNGSAVSDGGDGLYHKTTLDVSNYISPSDVLKVEVSAVGKNSRYFYESPAMTIGVNKAKSKLTLLPITGYELSDGVITWEPVGGASLYRVVDINMTVVKLIKSTDTMSYDMVGKNLILGVFPTSANPKIADADISPVAIDYLEGKGTAAEPYLIKNPFDLRAIDYYEFMYAEALAKGEEPAQNHYRVEKNINFNVVAALDSDSNIFTLSKPFYGNLNGNYKKLSNVRVVYDGGFWALFDYITTNATVRNMTFDSAEIENMLQKPERPLGGSVAMIAKTNYGTISGVTVSDARFTAMCGSVSGICTHNYGTVTQCEVSGEFIQVSIEVLATEDEPLKFNQACFEMAGVVLENYGTVSNNLVRELNIRGNSCKNIEECIYGDYGSILEITKYGDPYNNVRCGGGVVAVNRSGGVVSGNSYGTINLIKVNGDFANQEFGGIVAYNAPDAQVIYSESQLGTFTCTDADSAGAAISSEQGGRTDHRGTVVGKNEGTAIKG